MHILRRYSPTRTFLFRLTKSVSQCSSQLIFYYHLNGQLTFDEFYLLVMIPSNSCLYTRSPSRKLVPRNLSAQLIVFELNLSLDICINNKPKKSLFDYR